MYQDQGFGSGGVLLIQVEHFACVQQRSYSYSVIFHHLALWQDPDLEEQRKAELAKIKKKNSEFRNRVQLTLQEKKQLQLQRKLQKKVRRKRKQAPTED